MKRVQHSHPTFFAQFADPLNPGDIAQVFLDVAHKIPYPVDTVADLRHLKQSLRTIGSGLLLRESSFLASLGFKDQLGLFTDENTSFKKGELITWYYGWHVQHVPSVDMTLEERSHARSLWIGRVIILGNYTEAGQRITDPQITMIGLGGAAYANHADREEESDGIIHNNCEYSNIELAESRKTFFQPGLWVPDCNKKLVTLVAIEDIGPNTELLTNYGFEYVFDPNERDKAVQRKEPLKPACVQQERPVVVRRPATKKVVPIITSKYCARSDCKNNVQFYCGDCATTAYCSKGCQVYDWHTTHSSQCTFE